MSFTQLKEAVRAQFELMKKSTLYVVNYNRDEIWQRYFNAFSEASRQEHNCNSCKAFIRQAGAAVTICPTTYRINTIWDVENVPEEYAASVAALADYVRALPITGLFQAEGKSIGCDKNLCQRADGPAVVWHHFQVNTPPDTYARNRAALSGAFASSKQVLGRGLKELKQDALELVVELSNQGSLYRGPEAVPGIKAFLKLQKEYQELPEALRDNFCWQKAAVTPPSVARINNSAIGTLLNDLSEGKELEASVRSYLRVVDPANYNKPLSLVTPRMLATARKKLEELGLLSALDRRRLDTSDLKAANALFVYRPRTSSKDVFAEMAGASPVSLQTLSKVEEIGINDFVEKILPTATSLRVLVENAHLPRFVTMTGAQDPEAKNLMKWDNSFGWCYTGGVTDSIKERVKAAGGGVDGWMRISLAWHNHDDLDLHFHGDHIHVGFQNMSDSRLQARLDVDANRSVCTDTPVENIDIKRQLPDGTYYARVNNFRRRSNQDQGFTLEIEVGGETRTFSSDKNQQSGQDAGRIGFNVRNGVVTFADNAMSSSQRSTAKWGVTTGIWTQVKAVTLSPNHWTRPLGNKHWFWILEGCVSDEKTRPFDNEFLTDALRADRKVCEALAQKIEVAKAEGAELSGLGFSESQRDHLFVEVEGKFKRTVKVLF